MSEKRIEEFIEEIRTSPRAAELLNGKEAPKTPEEAVEMFAAVAKELGYDLTAEELGAYIREQDEARRARTDDQAEGVRRLDDSEVAEVSGGGEHADCKDTFKDYENCWFNDACDAVLHSYPDYKCCKANKDYQYTCMSSFHSCLLDFTV